MVAVDKVVAKLKGFLFYPLLFKKFGKGSFLINPIQVLNPQFISIGTNVRIRNHIRIEAISSKRIPDLQIGNNCNIEQNVHIICSGTVHIGNNCSIGARSSIVDTDHPFSNLDGKKIGEQLNDVAKSVRIGDGCFLGIGCMILPNVILGEGCVVGANAVVPAGTYPDRSVIAGIPARVLRLYYK